jgi:hypothetical protein
MDLERRAIFYSEILNPDGTNAGWREDLTPAQYRRMKHKAGHIGETYPRNAGSKQRHTPKRKRATR